MSKPTDVGLPKAFVPSHSNTGPAQISSRTVKSPAGRTLSAGEIKAGKAITIDKRTGRVVPPRPQKRKKGKT